MQSQSADVVVVGAGAAGMCAALEAARTGARVMVLEAQHEYGGAAATSGGGTCIAGSPLQEQWGVQDSPALALEDWLTWGGPEADAVWAQRYLEASVPEVFVWLAELGVEWVGLHHEEGNRAIRWHAPRRSGQGIMDALRAHVPELPIELRFDTPVVDVVQEAGRVVGVVAGTAGTGTTGTEEYRAPAVLIAAGGFNANAAMVDKHTRDRVGNHRVLLGGARCSQGTGHALLERVGARFTALDAIWMYPYATPDPGDPAGRRGLVVRGLGHDVWVNTQGVRFHDESQRGGATGARALLALDPPTCWAVIDARMAAEVSISDPFYRRAGQPDRAKTWELLNTSPFVFHGETLADLGAAAGIHAAALADTIADHNRRLAAGMAVDPDFGRSLAQLQPLQEPPFYAIQFFPLARKNFGGVQTNLDCQVLRLDGTPVPGLYAAGEVAGMAGGHINGRAGLEGTMIGPSMYSGRVAGRAMVGARTHQPVPA